MISRILTVSLAMGGLAAAASGILGGITWSSGEGTDINLGVSGNFTLEGHQNGERIIIDLHGVRPPSPASRTYHVGNSLVKQIRVGDHPPTTVRVVIDLETSATYSTAHLAAGVVIRVRKSLGAKPALLSKPLSRAGGGLKVPSRPTQARAVAGGLPKEPAPASPKATDPANIGIATGLGLKILDDTAQDIPYVLRMYRGFIGFGDVAGAPLQVLYQSPNWQPCPLSDENSLLSGYFALEFTDEKSSLIKELREKYSIPQRLIAYALFPKGFTEALHEEIRDAAARRGQSGTITGATILFTMLGDRGIQVKSTTVVPN